MKFLIKITVIKFGSFGQTILTILDYGNINKVNPESLF